MYDEYIKMVPKETAEFVNLVLKLFNLYVTGDHSICFKDSDGNNLFIHNKESKIFAIMLFAEYHLGNDSTTKFLLNELEVKDSFINFCDVKKLEEQEIDYDFVFSKTSSVFMPFTYLEDYIYLTPERIIYEYHKKFQESIKIQMIFDKSQWHGTFEDEYYKYISSQETELIKSFELDFYKDLSYELISYLERAAQIFRFFKQYNSDRSVYDHNVIKTEDDAIAFSLLLAIYFLEDNRIETFFENIGLK